MGVEQRWLRHLCVVRLEDHSVQFKADTKEIFSLSLCCIPHYPAMLLKPRFSNT